MNTYTFFKKNGGWHAHLADNTSKQKPSNYFDMVEGADSMLNLMSEGEDEVTLTLNTEPFDNAEVLELLQPCKPFLEGGYYLMREHDGKEINYKMWIADVTEMAFGEVPEKIYVRKGILD